MASPKDTQTKLDKIAESWQLLADGKTFGGMTLEQFKTAVKPSYDSRERVHLLEGQLQAEQIARESADKESLRIAQLIVNGVVGDPTEGPDSDLYEAMGYVRSSARKTGLTRKKTKPSTS